MPEAATIAKITSKGQITVPKKVRSRLQARPGDRLVFKEHPEGYLVAREQVEDVFAKYAGIERKGKGRSIEEIVRWFREFRGHDDFE